LASGTPVIYVAMHYRLGSERPKPLKLQIDP
jgi:hypothetical protein